MFSHLLQGLASFSACLNPLSASQGLEELCTGRKFHAPVVLDLESVANGQEPVAKKPRMD